MVYSDFTLLDLEEKFGVRYQRKRLQFEIARIEPSERLTNELAESLEMPIKTKKAKSEWIVVPILRELRRINHKFFTIYSGEVLIGNKAAGLIGECDFILTQDLQSYEIGILIFQIVEAQKHDLEDGVRQCATQLVGAKKYQERKGIVLEKIYGCTTGDIWQFIEYSDKMYIDAQKYYLNALDQLMGVLQSIMNYYKSVSA